MAGVLSRAVHRSRVTVKRWCWIFALAGLGSLCFFGALPMAAKVDAVAYAWLTAVRPRWVACVLHALPALPGGLLACQWLRPCSTDPRLWLRYPPLFFAVLIALVLVDIARWLDGVAAPMFFEHWPWEHAAVALIALIAAGVCARWQAVGRNAPPAPGQRVVGPAGPRGAVSEDQPAPQPAWEAIAAWARREQPVDPSEEDFFDRKPLVRRVARLLRGNDVGIGLLGPMGSGKSSVIARVKHHVRDATGPRLWFCDVHCWGLERSEFAPVHVLSRAVGEVGRHVDVSTLRGLPEHYQRFLTGEPSGWGTWVAGLLVPTRDPAEGLEQLSQVLEAVGARLVICIEDAERAGADFDPQHIQRLLWMLRQKRGISFVIAADLKVARFDFSKVCDHTEVLPRVDAEQVTHLLRSLQDHCESASFVEPLAQRQDVLGTQAFDPAWGAIARVFGRGELVAAIAELLDTPRQLKGLVRRVHRIWLSLKGEIDLEDVIVATVLREGAPDAFDFLLRNLDAVRHEYGDFHQEKKTLLEKAWSGVLAGASHAAAIQKLVDALDLRALRRSSATADAGRLQRLAVSWPTDYFRRLLAEEISDGESRDQEVLADMDGWLNGSNVMVERLLAPPRARYVAVWRHFSGRIPDERLLSLGDPLLAGLLARDRACSKGSDPALLAIRERLRMRAYPEQEDVEAWLTRHIVDAMHISLGFANDIYRLWVVREDGVLPWPSGEHVASQDPARRVRSAIVKTARLLFAEAERLRAALDDARPYAIRELMAPPDRSVRDTHLDADMVRDWAWMAPALLELMGTGPWFAPHLLRVVGKCSYGLQWEGVEEPRTREDYALHRPRVEALFGQRVDDVLRYLASLDDADRFFSVARTAAQSWLSERAAEDAEARKATS